MPNTLKAPAFKKGDKAKKTCGSDCMRSRKCDMFSSISRFTAVKVEVDRMNPRVLGCYDVVDIKGFTTTCPRDRLEKIEEKSAYWGPSQDEPMRPMEKPQPVSEAKKVDPVVAGVGDFGYGPACSFSTCHAMRNENHSASCPKEGKFFV